MVIVRSAVVALCALLACAASASAATAPASLFDAPGQAHALQCVTLASSPKPLRFADAATTGFEVTDQLSFDDGRCPAGTVRLDLHELIPSTAGPLAFHRGGNGYANDQNVKYGELAAADLAAELPATVASSGGRGAPCDLAAGPAYQAQVRSIPAAMKYKRPEDVPGGSNSGSSFLHYGDPGADQGDRHDIHYSYLVWSFVDVRGGGMVRTLLAPGQVVRLCDVQSIAMDSWGPDGAVNGHVTARYVQTYAGSCPVYGWMVWTHEYLGDTAGVVQHAVDATPAPPPPVGPPDASCPVAEPASAPVVTTEVAAGGGPTASTLTGTANPKGVPSTYWFEYGTAPEYGTATPPGALASTDRSNALAATVDGLAPASTYHYRLVASSAHGTTYGPDRTMTTAAPPEPPRIVPPPVVLPELRALRVSPSALRRARSRTGATARIGYDVSVAGTLELTFMRATLGMRVGAACRPAPRRGVPRGRHRCTRWVARGGTLTARTSTGKRTLRFGGWVGTHALPSGRYRLLAVPLDAEGRVGAARQAAFTLR
jgi:hypothetical protein